MVGAEQGRRYLLHKSCVSREERLVVFYTGNKQGLSSLSSLYANRLLDILYCEFIGCVRSEAERHDGGAAGASLALHSGSQARCLCCTVEPSLTVKRPVPSAVVLCWNARVGADTIREVVRRKHWCLRRI